VASYRSFGSTPPQEKGGRAKPHIGFHILAVAQLIGICCMLGIVHKGVAFPLVWTMLDKEGNTNSRERSELFNRFLVLFGD